MKTHVHQTLTLYLFAVAQSLSAGSLTGTIPRTIAKSSWYSGMSSQGGFFVIQNLAFGQNLQKKMTDRGVI